MPFDVLPQEVQTETRFKKFADAMLRGCGVTKPAFCVLWDGEGGACAMGALYTGLGYFTPTGVLLRPTPLRETSAMEMAYSARYGVYPMHDNDSGRFTREQIAARIAAL